MSEEFLKDIQFNELKETLLVVDYEKRTQSWFYVGSTLKFKKGIHRLDIFDQKLMVYKLGHEFIIQDRSCHHMKTDLSKGKLKDGNISCPMHNWKYNTKGESKSTCKKLKTYPVKQIGTHLFVFIGEDANYFAFPDFPQISFENLQSSHKPLHFEIDIDYFLLTGNGFDLNHFESMHGRVPIKQPKPYLKSKNRIHIKHEFKNTSNQFFDRLLRTFLSPIGHLSFEVIAGNMVLAETKIKNRVSRLLFVLTPGENKKSFVTLIPFVENKSNTLFKTLFNKISLGIRRVFIKEFFRHEIEQAQELEFNPEGFVASDQIYMIYLIWFKQYLDSLEANETALSDESKSNNIELS